MPGYYYHALTTTGLTKKGVIEADSERHARSLLRDQGLIPTQLKTSHKKNTHASKGMRAQDMALFTRQLATLISAGLPIDEALQGVAEQTEKNTPQTIILGVRSYVLEGFSLAQALSEFPRSFSELYVATVASGEQAGHLDHILENLADYIESQQQNTNKVQQALIYPVLMMLVSSGIIAFLLTFVVPKIIEVFTTSGQSLPTATRLLISMSTIVKNDGIYGLLIGILLIVVWLRLLQYPAVRHWWHGIILKLPMISYLSKTTQVARYIHTFSILFSAGVNVLETMKVSASVVSNLIMRDAFHQASDKVREGAPIHLALKQTHFLNPMAVHLIANGEKSGKLPQMMHRAASHLDHEVNRIIDTSLTLLEPFIILMMGAVVLFIVLATLLPIFSMEQLVV